MKSKHMESFFFNFLFFYSFLFHFIFFIFKNFIVIQVVVCLSPPPLPSSQPSPPLSPDSTPPRFCPCVLYSCTWKPFTLFPSLSPLTYPSGYCPFVLNFNVSGYILLTCKPGSKRQIPYDLTFKWNIINKTKSFLKSNHFMGYS